MRSFSKRGESQMQIEMHVDMMILNAPNVYMVNCTSVIQCYAQSQRSVPMPIQCCLLLLPTVRARSSLRWYVFIPQVIFDANPIK